MVSVPLNLIKPFFGIAAVAAIFLYGKHLYNERNHYRDSYAQEVKIHQETANNRLAEQFNVRKAHDAALKLENELNELRKKNAQYAACIANGTCSVKLRSQNSETSANSNTSTTPKHNDSTRGIEFTVQQDIFNLRTSITIDELKITELQKYINDWCYKPN